MNKIKKMLLKQFGLPKVFLETSKAKKRRVKEGFFKKYCTGKGIDIGYGGDLLKPGCRFWDWMHGDAHFLEGLKDNHFDFVYSSHTLEHMAVPKVALKNWWRILKPNGYLILYLPHRDLYEKKKELPSRWNLEHRHFFLPYHDEPPNTLGVVPLLEKSLTNMNILEVRTCNFENPRVHEPFVHSDGEYSIEAIIQKT